MSENYWTTPGSGLSNESSDRKSFQRTISAQVRNQTTSMRVCIITLDHVTLDTCLSLFDQVTLDTCLSLFDQVTLEDATALFVEIDGTSDMDTAASPTSDSDVTVGQQMADDSSQSDSQSATQPYSQPDWQPHSPGGQAGTGGSPVYGPPTLAECQTSDSGSTRPRSSVSPK